MLCCCVRRSCAIRFSCLYGGEDYDGRGEQAKWDEPGFTDMGWGAGDIVGDSSEGLVSQPQAPIKVMQVFPTVKITEPPATWDITTWRAP